MNSTLKFYKDNYKSYIDSTIDVDMSEQYSYFEKELKGKNILDVGSGSLRDSIYFREKEYNVTCLDPVEEFHNHALENNFESLNISITNLSNKKFDGIWACASLLHLTNEKLDKAFFNIKQSLNENGVFYCSFKKGIGEEVINDRFFNYMNEEKLKVLINKYNFKLINCYETGDLLNRGNIWLNVILK